MADVGDGLLVVEREGVRLVVRDREDRILLFLCVKCPRSSACSESCPVAGVDARAMYVDAAVRKLREEAGIAVNWEGVGPPTWSRVGVFRHRDVRQVQHEVVVEVRLDVAGPRIDETGRLDCECAEDDFDDWWWPTRDVIDGGGLFYPRSISRLLARFVAGEQLDEPPELWS